MIFAIIYDLDFDFVVYFFCWLSKEN